MINVDTVADEKEYIGFQLSRSSVDTFFSVQCPCGVLDTFPINQLPVTNTPQSCGVANHWAVKFTE
jgi:hypothetical protein